MSALLRDIVSDLVLKSGQFNVSEIDLTSLTNDSVDGFILKNSTTIRTALEYLQSAFFFDKVEEDGKLKFKSRGNASILSIPESDLGAREPGQETENIVVTRQSELELPQEVNVEAMDPDNDYWPTEQRSLRFFTKSREKVNVLLPIVLKVDRVRQIAEVGHFLAWVEKNNLKFSLSNKYLFLSVADVIDVTARGTTYKVRINDIDYGQPGILEIDSVAEEPGQYVNTSKGIPSKTITNKVKFVGKTIGFLMDIPMLREEDNDSGFYIAVGKESDSINWKGAGQFSSLDNLTYKKLANFSISAAHGVPTNKLQIGNTFVFDFQRTVNIEMKSGTLSSAAEIDVLNGVNTALLGNEIIQWQTATLEADGTYTLSGLLRGRRGTEWAMSTHQIGERFIVLTSAVLKRMIRSSDEIGLSKFYKAVSTGLSLDDVTAIQFSNLAVGKKPFSPVHITGIRDGSNNLTIDWIRRTRFAGGWRDFVDAPLNESNESYDLEILSGTSVKRTVSGLTTTQYIYSAADQITDFGSTQSAVKVRIYQLSSIVGRGTKGESTI